jgi:hypothetical protein
MFDTLLSGFSLLCPTRDRTILSHLRQIICYHSHKMENKMEKDAHHQQPPQEFPAVVTTIVGGRPPGCGKQVGQIPRGIEVLVKKASVDPGFRSRLLASRSAAAREIGLALEPAEAMMLDLVPAAQLEAIIVQTTVEPAKQSLFLGKAAAVMLAALGASAIMAPAQVQATKGVRFEPPVTAPTPPATQSTQPATDPAATQLSPIEQLERSRVICLGVRPLPQPATAPAATQPCTTSASAPATAPSAIRDQLPAILKQLDSQSFKDRQEAQKKLEALGPAALQCIEEALDKSDLSLEVATRIQSAMLNIQATTRPALLNPPEPRPARSDRFAGPTVGEPKIRL